VNIFHHRREVAELRKKVRVLELLLNTERELGNLHLPPPRDLYARPTEHVTRHARGGLRVIRGGAA